MEAGPQPIDTLPCFRLGCLHGVIHAAVRAYRAPTHIWSIDDCWIGPLHSVGKVSVWPMAENNALTPIRTFEDC